MYQTTFKLRPMTAMQGFSLIELLVVLMIVGLMSSLVVVALPGSGSAGRPGEAQAGQLAGLLRLGRAEAVVRATPMALMTQLAESDDASDSLHWLMWQGNQWIAAGMEPFQIPGHTDFRWLKPLRRQMNANHTLDNKVPDIVFYPTGEITDFEVQLGEITVQLDDFGNVLVSSDHADHSQGSGV